MDARKLCWAGMIIGSGVGGYLPVLWGGEVISFAGVTCSLIGGLGGIWLGYRLGRSL